METEQPDLLANLELRRIGSSTFRRNSGVRTVKRRNFLQTLAGGSVMLLLPEWFVDRTASGIVQAAESIVALKCLSDIKENRWLDGRTRDGTVGLVPELNKNVPGTKWSMQRMLDSKGISQGVAFKCMRPIEGPRWLDGRTKDGSVGLAPGTGGQFTGTRWVINPLDEGNHSIVGLKCLGTIEGPRWLDGRTKNGSVSLTTRTGPPSTKWLIVPYPLIRE